MNLIIELDSLRSKHDVLSWVTSTEATFYKEHNSNDLHIEYEDVDMIGNTIILKDITSSREDVFEFIKFLLSKHFGVKKVVLENL